VTLDWKLSKNVLGISRKPISVAEHTQVVAHAAAMLQAKLTRLSGIKRREHENHEATKGNRYQREHPGESTKRQSTKEKVEPSSPTARHEASAQKTER